MAKRATVGPHFVNVDLEVWSPTELGGLATALESKALILHAGRVGRRFLVSFEASGSRLTDAERTIWALLRVVASLPPPARRDWKRATARVFNVGFDGGEPVKLRERPERSGRWFPARGGDASMSYETSFSTELLQAVAKVEGTITTTVYAPTELGRRRAGGRATRSGGARP